MYGSAKCSAQHIVSAQLTAPRYCFHSNCMLLPALCVYTQMNGNTRQRPGGTDKLCGEGETAGTSESLEAAGRNATGWEGSGEGSPDKALGSAEALRPGSLGQVWKGADDPFAQAGR